MIDAIPPAEQKAPGVWGDDWTVADLVAHLAEWGEMFLEWRRIGSAGETPEMPAPGYTWKDTPALNRAIQKKHAQKSSAVVRAAFDRAHLAMSKIAHDLDEADLLTPGRFDWTGKIPLVSYLSANSASHYRTAVKILKRRLRVLKSGAAPKKKSAAAKSVAAKKSATAQRKAR